MLPRCPADQEDHDRPLAASSTAAGNGCSRKRQPVVRHDDRGAEAQGQARAKGLIGARRADFKGATVQVEEKDRAVDVAQLVGARSRVRVDLPMEHPGRWSPAASGPNSAASAAKRRFLNAALGRAGRCCAKLEGMAAISALGRLPGSCRSVGRCAPRAPSRPPSTKTDWPVTCLAESGAVQHPEVATPVPPGSRGVRRAPQAGSGISATEALPPS